MTRQTAPFIAPFLAEGERMNYLLIVKSKEKGDRVYSHLNQSNLA